MSVQFCNAQRSLSGMNSRFDEDDSLSPNFSQPRTQHAHNTSSAPYSTVNGPLDPSGRQVDVSDRPLFCASSNMRSEVVVGGSDHALYAIDVRDPCRAPVTMYSKSYGHTDWVTSVAHMADGSVLSAAMDGKLCLWSATNRRACVDLHRSSSHPVSKVVSDMRFNTALSCAYDGNIEVWKFSEMSFDADVSSSSSSSSVAARRSFRNASAGSRAVSLSPMMVLGGAHAQPVLECAYHENSLATGDKAGSLVLWDLARGTALTRFRAHPSPITALIYDGEHRTVISAGADGFVKIWDPRSSGSGLVSKIAVFAEAEQSPAPSYRPMDSSPSFGGRGNALSRAGRGVISSSAGGRTTSSRPASNPALAALPKGQRMSGGSPVSVMAGLRGRGGGELSYLAVGGGSPEDSRLCFLDARASFRPVEYLSYHRNGIYSICVVGDDTVLTGDGVGMLYCQNIQSLLRGGALNPQQCVRYGLGASEKGAIRAINCVGGRVVTTNEDGKVMIYDFE